MAKKAVQRKMSVRELEQEVRLYFTRKSNVGGPRERIQSPEIREMLNDMKRVFATKVKLRGNESKGRITIDYFTADDLNRIYALVQQLKQFKG